MVREDENPFASPLSSSSPPLNDALISFPRRAICGSVLVMLPWPISGIAACMGWSLFEKSSEAIWMFGSVTMIFLFPLAFFVSSEWIYGTLIGIVWLLVLLLPLSFGKKPLKQKSQVALVLVCQSLFSAIQAVLGFLVILGKQC